MKRPPVSSTQWLAIRFEDAVLLNAFAGGLLIRHRVAGAGVKQAMVAARGAGGDVVPLQAGCSRCRAVRNRA